MTDLAGKVLIVTETHRGSGAAAARLFAERGAKVVLAGRDEQALSKLAADLAWDEFEAFPVATDISDVAAVERLVAAAIDRYGRLDGAFNCVEDAARGRDAFAEIDPREFDRILKVNLRSVFLCLRCELRRLTAGGAVVNFSSSAGLGGASGTAAYSAATYGVIGLTRAAVHDYGSKGIRINTIAAEPIAEGGEVAASEQIGHRGAQRLLPRVGRDEEIAQLAGWLISDAASMVNGAVISIESVSG